jgi:L-fuconolactonase
MKPVREDWLKLTAETAIDPDLRICDPHHHLWYETDNSYSLEEFLHDTSGGHRIVQTVFVESRKMLRKNSLPAMQPVGETEYVRDVVNRTGQSDKIRVSSGIVGFADLTLGSAVIPVLEAHLEAGQSRFKGIRYSSTWDSSSEIKSSSARGILLDSHFRQGFACLKSYNLCFDAWVYHPQLIELIDLAQTYPDITIILDHMGGPLGIGPYSHNREEVFQMWKRSIAALASCDNVSVKLGGLGMDICGFGWSERAVPPCSTELAKAFGPYFLWCIEKFGFKRCMFESNFPVDKRAFSYTVLWNAFKIIAKDFSAEERQAIFHDTAVRIYSLPSDNLIG